MFENGITITKFVRSSQLGGALIGGVALGGVGAIIGGLSGNTQSSDIINSIDLHLVVHDLQSPIHDIKLLNLKTKKDSIIYETAIQKARYWHSLIEVLIKKSDSEEKISPQYNPNYIADEIKKLADLKDSGILSQEEFQEQKERILKS